MTKFVYLTVQAKTQIFERKKKRAKIKEQRKLAFLSRRDRMKSSLKDLKSSDTGLNA